jgi:hypothetical protein
VIGIARAELERRRLSVIDDDWSSGVVRDVSVTVPAPKRLTAAAERRLVRDVRAAAIATGARVIESSVARPSRTTIAVVFEVEDPPRFLQRNTATILRALYPYLGRLDGAYVGAVDPAEEVIWEYALSAPLGGTRSGTRPELHAAIRSPTCRLEPRSGPIVRSAEFLERARQRPIEASPAYVRPQTRKPYARTRRFSASVNSTYAGSAFASAARSLRANALWTRRASTSPRSSPATRRGANESPAGVPTARSRSLNRFWIAIWACQIAAAAAHFWDSGSACAACAR